MKTIAFALLVALPARQPVPVPQPEPSPAPLPAPTASAAPSPSVSLSPSPSPPPTTGATTAPIPAPSATPLFHFVFVSTPAPRNSGRNASPPQIREIDLSDQTLVTPGQLRVRVLTSPEVVSVIARTMGREVTLPQMQPGQFGGSAYVSNVPFFLKNHLYDVEFVAAAADGRIASIILSLGLK